MLHRIDIMARVKSEGSLLVRKEERCSVARIFVFLD